MLKDFEKKLTDAVESYKNTVKDFGAERVSPTWLADVKVSTDDGLIPIKSIASINLVDNRALEVKTWDRSKMAAVESALSRHSLISSVLTQKDRLICTFPELTAEEREKLARKLSDMTEQTRIGMRIVRQKEIDYIKAQKLSETNHKIEMKNLQNIFDRKMEDLKAYFSQREKHILRR